MFNLILSAIIGITTFSSYAAQASGSVTLYSPYTKISVPPGESVDYSIDVINNSKELQNKEISISGIPRGWTYTLKSGGWSVGQLAVLPGEKKTLSLKVDVPYQVNKGNYHLKVTAGDSSVLRLVINVSEKGTYETEYSTDQPNMQGSSTSTFTFKTTLKNRTADQQLYALIANAARGWNVTFKADYKQVTSVELGANTTKDITVEINPPAQIEAGTYQIPVSAKTNSTAANVQLEVVITGSYSMELTTPTGLLSSPITAGDVKRLELVVKNTGSSVLNDIKLSATQPSRWEVVFDPIKIDHLLPGKEEQVFVSIKADKNAIPGDYVTNLEAKTPESTSKAALRMSVKTPMLWGWIGVLIIFVALGSVYYLFRKYGRR
jgi:uncharacterized membrane protein